ncbi:MAG: ferrous iron transport protein B [Spirochaetota bacterium]|nr:ferrous iron transport protein B [Spirochaetota bacterium]
MHTHHHNSSLNNEIDFKNNRKIVLVGNPNVGKSIFFGHFSKQYTNVSNYAGTTIDIHYGKWRDNVIIDTPGIYSVSSYNDEEKVARDVVLEADIIINIVDAVRLERDLFLTQQLIDMGKPIVVALNFMDEAEKNGLEIDVNLLSKELGVIVIPTVARLGKGFKELDDLILKARSGIRSNELKERINEILNVTKSEANALLILEGDPEITNRFNIGILSDKDNIYLKRREKVNHTVSLVVKELDKRTTFSVRIGKWSIEPVKGTLILILVLYLLYLVIGQLIARDLVGLTEGELMSKHWNPLVQRTIGSLTLDNNSYKDFQNINNSLLLAEKEYIKAKIEKNSVVIGELRNRIKVFKDKIRDFEKSNPVFTILAGRFGLLTMTITYIIGLLLPLVIGFYFMLALLEDSGYLPRLATLVDSLLMKIGLNGRAVIPLILGFGCVTLGTISTRLLTTSREKRIATTILNFTIPCSAQLGVITVMLIGRGDNPGVSKGYIILFVGVLFGVFIFIGTLLNKILPGKTHPLLIDLPPMRIPKLKNILLKIVNRTYFFMKEASPWFFIGAFVITILQVTGGLEIWESSWSVITENWLKLPRETSTAFIMGMIRRDFGAAGLMSLDDPFQIVVSLLVITLFVPCIASFMILLKERGIKEGLLVWVGALGFSFLIGGIVAQIGSIF